VLEFGGRRCVFTSIIHADNFEDDHGVEEGLMD
jgi:hypothetical protein